MACYCLEETGGRERGLVPEAAWWLIELLLLCVCVCVCLMLDNDMA